MQRGGIDKLSNYVQENDHILSSNNATLDAINVMKGLQARSNAFANDVKWFMSKVYTNPIYKNKQIADKIIESADINKKWEEWKKTQEAAREDA